MAYSSSPQMSMQPMAFAQSQPAMPAQYGQLIAPASAPVQTTRILHLANFSPSLKTKDIQAIFSEWEDDRGGFKIKWVNDTACYIIFADAHVAKRAFLTTLADPPKALVDTPAEPDRGAASLRAYAGDDAANIIASVQQRGRARSNASSHPHNRRASMPNGAALPGVGGGNRRESVGNNGGQPSGGEGAQPHVGDAARRMVAAGIGRPFAAVAGGSPANGSASLTGSAIA